MFTAYPLEDTLQGTVLSWDSLHESCPHMEQVSLNGILDGEKVGHFFIREHAIRSIEPNKLGTGRFHKLFVEPTSEE